MLRSILILPDGTELSSGVTGENAIKTITLTQCVNDGQELSPGSVCAAMLEATVIAPEGGFSVAEGQEVTLLQDDGAQRQQIGIFRAEKPVRSSANTFRLTAYDRVSLLDQDLTHWLGSLTGWPYTLNTLSKMVCNRCGLEYFDKALMNGERTVGKFTPDSVTGRQLIRWIGQLTGNFFRATPQGMVEFDWYRPAEKLRIGPKYVENTAIEYEDGVLQLRLLSGVIMVSGQSVQLSSPDMDCAYDENGTVTLTIPDGDRMISCFQGGLKYEDYEVAPVERVLLQRNGAAAVAYPERSGNTYTVSANPLTNSMDNPAVVAKNLHTLLSEAVYTPCTVTVPAELYVKPGQILTVTDANGASITAYVMCWKQTGQRLTLSCTGNPRRDSAAAVNEVSYRSLSGKVLNLSATVDGLQVEAADAEGRLSSLKLDVDGIETRVETQTLRADGMEADISSIDQHAKKIDMSVQSVKSNADGTEKRLTQLELDASGIRAEVASQTQSIAGVNKSLTRLQQTAENVKLSVEKIQENGTATVTTSTGYTFGADGLRIRKAGQQMENLLDDRGMQVSRGDTVMLRANADGVVATDVSVRNYLIVGNHARFEDHGSSRTACFYI